MFGQFTLEHWQDGLLHVGRLAEIPFVVAQGNSVEELRKNIQDAYNQTIAGNCSLPPPDVQREPLQLELPNSAILNDDHLPPIATIEEWEDALDEAVEECARIRGPNPPVLSDEAISRESIYEGNPKL